MTDGCPPPGASSTLKPECCRWKWACNAQITGSHFKINARLRQRDAADLWVNPLNGAFCFLFSPNLRSVMQAGCSSDCGGAELELGGHGCTPACRLKVFYYLDLWHKVAFFIPINGFICVHCVRAYVCVSACWQGPGCEINQEFRWIFLVDGTQTSSPVFTCGSQPIWGRRPATVFLPHQNDGGRDLQVFTLTTQVFLLGKTLA